MWKIYFFVCRALRKITKSMRYTSKETGFGKGNPERIEWILINLCRRAAADML
jgi:hypothetical protein